MSGEIRSPVTGTVAMQYCDEGGAVETEQIVVSIESMKMMFELRAPVAGVVHFTVELGQTVDKGTVVAEILA